MNWMIHCAEFSFTCKLGFQYCSPYETIITSFYIPHASKLIGLSLMLTYPIFIRFKAYVPNFNKSLSLQPVIAGNKLGKTVLHSLFNLRYFFSSPTKYQMISGNRERPLWIWTMIRVFCPCVFKYFRVVCSILKPHPYISARIDRLKQVYRFSVLFYCLPYTVHSLFLILISYVKIILLQNHKNPPLPLKSLLCLNML